MRYEPDDSLGPARPLGAQPPGAPRRVVVGIDPGLTRCGVGVIAGSRGDMRHVDHLTIRTPPGDRLSERLAHLFESLEQVLANHRPDLVAVERVLFSRNVATAMATGQAAGVALLAAARAGVEVVEVTPTRAKSTVAGHGNADKEAVTRMVAVQLGMAELPRPADAADALAVALAAMLDSGPTGANGSAAPKVRAGTWEAHLAARGLDVVGGTS